MPKRLLQLSMCLVLLISVTIANSSFAAEEVNAEVKDKIAKLPLFKSISITAINPSPVEGIYEVVLPGPRVVYLSLEKQVVFAGPMFGSDGANLTKDALNRSYAVLAAKISSTIDRSLAIRIGSGPIEIFEFTDVDCPTCRQSESYFADKGEYFTRYIYLMPQEKQHPEAKKKTMYILNAKNVAEAYRKATEGAFDKSVPEFKESELSTKGYAYMQSLKDNYGIVSTPTFVWPDSFAQGFDKNGFDKTIASIKAAKEAAEKMKAEQAKAAASKPADGNAGKEKEAREQAAKK